MSYEEEKQDRKIEQLEAEIERLRGEMENYGDDYVCQMKSKDTRIKELEALRSDILEAIRRPKTTSNDGLILYLKELDEYNIRTTKRVGELEDALVEKQTALMPSAPRCYAEAQRQAAIEQLQAEGKIGPDAALKKQWDDVLGTKPRSWQITEERVEALKVATGEMDLSENIFYLNSLKTMLEEAGRE